MTLLIHLFWCNPPSLTPLHFPGSQNKHYLRRSTFLGAALCFGELNINRNSYFHFHASQVRRSKVVIPGRLVTSARKRQ